MTKRKTVKQKTRDSEREREKMLPQGHLVLEFRRGPLLNDVIGALEVKVLEGLRVLAQQVVRVQRKEGHAKQAAKVVNTCKGKTIFSQAFEDMTKYCNKLRCLLCKAMT